MDDIFSDDESILYSTACTIKDIVELRNSLLDPDIEEHKRTVTKPEVPSTTDGIVTNK